MARSPARPTRRVRRLRWRFDLSKTNIVQAEGSSEFHRPVMVDEVLEVLAPVKGETFLDLTTGAGGHAVEIAARLGGHGVLVGMDRDREVLRIARRRLEDAGFANFQLYHGNFIHCRDALDEAAVDTVDGILLDLGVSSLQLDRSERGFSFAEDGPLDMRMDTDQQETAADIVNHAGRGELERIFREYGQERFARRIARMIVRERQQAPIETTGRLAALAKRAYGPGWRRIHPATRIFQALRITVNRELENLKQLLDLAPEIMSEQGRIAVISFHSLEDRIVKEDFRSRAYEGEYRLITRKPLRPTPTEVKANPRARSAMLRAAQRSVQ